MIVTLVIFSLLIIGLEQLNVSDEIVELTEKLYAIDQGVGELITINENYIDNGNFFLSMNDTAFKSASFKSFLELRKYFHRDKCDVEINNSSKTAATKLFLDSILNTEVLMMTQNYIVSKGILNKTFRSYLESLWFEEYSSCDGVIGSSGFEHVFVGEANETNVEGYHNWASLYLDERDASLTLTKLLNSIHISDKMQAAAISFQWDNAIKPISSLFIGSTPELEIALYTLASLFNANETLTISMNDIAIDIQTILKPSREQIYTAYPVIPLE